MEKENKLITDKNEITFEHFDKLKLKKYTENLYQIMEKGTESSIKKEESYTISLNAEFGNGKTTFLKMFENFIKTEKQKYDVLFVNAWETDFYSEPVISILSEFADWMEKNEIDSKKVIEIIGNISNQIIQSKTGINFRNIKDSLEIGRELFNNFKQRKGAIKQIRESIKKYTKDKKLLIIVDELDRARPDYAVRFLEGIKHFFDIKNVVFLVGVNRKQMEATVRCLYGKDLKFDGYYRKFFKQEIELPDPYEKAQRFVDDLIQKTKMKNDFNSNEDCKLSVYYSCKMFELTLREIEYFMDKFEFVLDGISDGPHINILVNCYSFFICLYLKENALFNKTLDNNFKLNDLLQIFKTSKIRPLIKEKPIISVINLLEIVACSVMTSKSEDTDIFELLKIIIGKEVAIPIGPSQKYKHERNRYYAILDSMYQHRRNKATPVITYWNY